jgi:CRISPR/Cas system-associated endonuclease Cas1
MGRTLYINHTNKPVILKDGPSIWVKERDKAGRRIPARLISRVIIIGNVHLDAGIITLLADNNVPISFMNNRAEESAVVIPYNHRLPDHYKEQKVLLESEGTIHHFEKWASAKRTLLQLNMLRRYVPKLAAKCEVKGLGEGNYQEILKRVRHVGEKKWLAVNSIVTAIFRNMIIENLIHSGLDPHLGVIHRRHNFGLALDICYIMGGESDIHTLQFFRSTHLEKLIKYENGQWIVTEQGIRNIIHRFENKRQRTKEIIENIIDELFDLIREMLS